MILPDQLLDSSHVGDSVREFVEHMVVFVASRIQEVCVRVCVCVCVCVCVHLLSCETITSY